MRSEKMTFVQLIIPVESAHRAVTYLGELGLLQFRDVCFLFSPYDFIRYRYLIFASSIQCVDYMPSFL